MKKGSHHSADSLLQMKYARKLVWKQRGFREMMKCAMRQWHIEHFCPLRKRRTKAMIRTAFIRWP